MRILIAYLLCTSFVHAAKPTILHFKASWCGPCQVFNQDCQRSKTMLREFNRRYLVTPAIDVDRSPDKARQYGITSVPAWVIVDNGRVIGRVIGYAGKTVNARETDLFQRLDAANVPLPELTPPREIPRPATPPVRDELTDVLKANEALRQQYEQQSEARRLIEAEEARQRQRVRSLEELRDRLIAESRRQQERESLPSAPPHRAEDVTGKPDEAEEAKTGFFRSAFRHGVQIALAGGLTAAQAEVAVPLLGLGGPVGAAALVGWKLLQYRRRRKDQQPEQRTTQRTVVVDSPTPQPKRQLETQIVNVESDSYQRAHETARQHIARRYPGSQEVLEAELSLTKQFLAGQV